MENPFKEEDASITDNNGITHTQRLAILYQYIIEGLLPMLSAFAEEFTKISSSYKDDRVGTEAAGSHISNTCFTHSDKLTRFGTKLKV